MLISETAISDVKVKLIFDISKRQHSLNIFQENLLSVGQNMINHRCKPVVMQ